MTEVDTVFDSETNFTHKHPLNGQWTLWFDNPHNKRPPSNHWEASLKNIIEFESVEDFWGVHLNAVPPTNLPLGSNYHLFRTGIKPAWEDPKNANGGKWTMTFPRSKRDELLNAAWMNAALVAIGEIPDFSEEICGLVCSVRKSQDRISIWLSTGDEEKCKAIGKAFKIACGLTDSDRVKYEMHPKDPNSKPQMKYEV